MDIPVQLTYILEGTEEFRNLAPERRNCYFPNEKILNYFPIYSEGNCYLECVWEVASERCGCVPWFLSKLFPGSVFNYVKKLNIVKCSEIFRGAKL